MKLLLFIGRRLLWLIPATVPATFGTGTCRFGARGPTLRREGLIPSRTIRIHSTHAGFAPRRTGTDLIPRAEPSADRVLPYDVPRRRPTTDVGRPRYMDLELQAGWSERRSLIDRSRPADGVRLHAMALQPPLLASVLFAVAFRCAAGHAPETSPSLLGVSVLQSSLCLSLSLLLSLSVSPYLNDDTVWHLGLGEIK